MQSSVTDAANQTLRLRESKSLHAPHPHAISADSGAGLVAKATYLVRRGRLRYQLIAKATYLRLRLRFILRSSGKRINAARLLEIGGPAERLAQFLLV
jgi:hypothetical protein